MPAFKLSKTQMKTLWGAGAVVALFVSYLICDRIYYLLHNNDWSVVLFWFGMVVILIAAFSGAKKVMICTVAGYVISFIAGIVFNFEYDSVVIDGVVMERNYTAWQIWTVMFLVLIIAGIVWEIIGNTMKKRSK